MLSHNKGASNVCQGVVKAAHILHEGGMIRVRGGRQTKFWANKWLLDTPLADMCFAGIDAKELECTVAEMWFPGHGRNWEKIRRNIPGDI